MACLIESAQAPPNRPRVPLWLRLIQDTFLIWVLAGAWWGYVAPDAAAAGSSWIPEGLAAIMLGMGLTLTAEDFKKLRSASTPLVLGVGLQYFIMPLAAWIAAVALELPPPLAVGLILVGACPGGTASNVVTFLARGDVALSVGMTTASTLISPIMTPLWVWLLASMWLPIDPVPLFWTVVKVVLIPVILGSIIRRFWSPRMWFMEGVLPLFSMAVIAWIVGAIVGLNHDRLAFSGAVVAAVALHNAVGLLSGYLGARQIQLSEPRRRSVAIEVGMQNSGLAVALSVAHLDPIAAIPGAVFSVWHNVTGPLLAGIWRRREQHEPRM